MRIQGLLLILGFGLFFTGIHLYIPFSGRQSDICAATISGTYGILPAGGRLYYYFTFKDKLR